MECIKGKDGYIMIYCERQMVLKISEVSDKDTVNLFLYPGDNADILETNTTEYYPDCGFTHEVIAVRN